MQTLQKSSVASRAQPSQSLLAPVRQAAARRVCFKSGVPQQNVQQTRATLSAAGQVVAEPLVTGMDKAARADLLKLPKGYHWYETMMILRPALTDEERDRELAKFEAFLNKQECLNINALVRGSSRLAYNIKNHWEGSYVVYTYSARRATAQAVQKLLSTPEVGSEDIVMRHMTFCKY